MSKVIIRQEKTSDYEVVYNLIEEAFKSMAFSDGDEHNLVKRLRHSEAYVPELALVAEIDHKIVGHILFTEIKIGKKIALALAPVSVSPEYQNMGVGSKLIHAGHEVASHLGYEAIVLLGHEEYYPKFGYVKACDYGILLPFEVPDENFMVYEIKENTLNKYKGEVIYPPEFFDKN